MKDFEDEMVYLFQYTRSPVVINIDRKYIKDGELIYSFTDSLNLSILSEAGVLVETSRNQVPGKLLFLF